MQLFHLFFTVFLFNLLLTSPLCSAPYAYVANFSDGNVTVINTGTETVIGTITIGAGGPGIGADAIAVNAEGSQVYVAGNQTPGFVYIISTSPLPGTVIASITVGNSPVGIAVNGTKVYVTNSADSTVNIIDTTTHLIVGTVTLSGTLEGIAITPNGAKGYVAENTTSRVFVFDTSTGAIIGTITVGSGPLGLSIKGTAGYVADFSSNQVTAIETGGNTITGTVNLAVGANPTSLVFNPNGTRVYVANSGTDNVNVIRTSDNTIVGTIAVGNNPTGIAITPDGAKVYVTNSADNNVSIINTSLASVTNTVTVGTDPRGVAIAPVDAPIIVTCTLVTSTVTPVPGPQPPTGLSGCRKKDKSAYEAASYNLITWNAPSTGPAPIQYLIFRVPSLPGGAAIIPASHALRFKDLNLQKNTTYTYFIISQAANGFSSSASSITISPENKCPCSKEK